MNNKDTFRYTYSAKEQEEIKNIRKKYDVKQEDKIEKLRRLDESVTRKATTLSLFVGVFGTLIMGAGMSLIMSDFSAILGAYEELALILGIVIGLLGASLAIIAYPVYNITLKHQRKKIAPEIIKLTDELLK